MTQSQMMEHLAQNVGITNSRFSAFPSDWNQGLVTGFNDAAPVSGPIVGAGLPGSRAGLRWIDSLGQATSGIRFAPGS